MRLHSAHTKKQQTKKDASTDIDIIEKQYCNTLFEAIESNACTC